MIYLVIVIPVVIALVVIVTVCFSMLPQEQIIRGKFVRRYVLTRLRPQNVASDVSLRALDE